MRRRKLFSKSGGKCVRHLYLIVIPRSEESLISVNRAIMRQTFIHFILTFELLVLVNKSKNTVICVLVTFIYLLIKNIPCQKKEARKNKLKPRLHYENGRPATKFPRI